MGVSSIILVMSWPVWGKTLVTLVFGLVLWIQSHAVVVEYQGSLLFLKKKAYLAVVSGFTLINQTFVLAYSFT